MPERDDRLSFCAPSLCREPLEEFRDTHRRHVERIEARQVAERFDDHQVGHLRQSEFGLERRLECWFVMNAGLVWVCFEFGPFGQRILNCHGVGVMIELRFGSSPEWVIIGHLKVTGRKQHEVALEEPAPVRLGDPACVHDVLAARQQCVVGAE